MKRLLLLTLLSVSTAQAKSPSDVCQMVQTKAPTTGALVKFVVIGSGMHGRIATSRYCPRLSTGLDLSGLGNGKKARTFTRWLGFLTPKLKSGITEVEATVDFSGSELIVRRVHSYRELSEDEAKPFLSDFSPTEEAKLRAIADKAAKDAAAAARH